MESFGIGLFLSLTSPDQLREGLEAFQAEKEQHIGPLRTRLALVQEILETDRAKLNRLLDLYLADEFPREILVERRSRLEMEIASLEREKIDALSTIEAQTISVEQMTAIQKFGREIASELDLAESNGELMRQIINILDVQVRLSAKDGERFALIRCGIGQEFLSLSSTATYALEWHSGPSYREYNRTPRDAAPQIVPRPVAGFRWAVGGVALYRLQRDCGATAPPSSPCAPREKCR